jgi:hypothetical protein
VVRTAGRLLFPPPDCTRRRTTYRRLDQRHRRYLREYKRAVYTALLLSNKLNRYLADIDQQAEELFSRLVQQMTEREGITEQLKADDPMAWGGRMNNIQARVTEIVNSEIVYS